MDSSTWIGIYLPLFIIFLIIIPQKQELKKTVLMKIKKRRDGITMTNEIIKRYIGKNCKIYTGSFGTSVTGKITNVEDNWLEVKTKKGIELINADFIYNIKIK